jgi:hypothetical protein
MTAEKFRSIALGFSGAVESAHMRHPDFRCNGRIFATLDYPEKGWGMVKLTPSQQRFYLKRAPGVFEPAGGAWGRSGSTTVKLELARKSDLKAALSAAFRNAAASTKKS